MVVAALYIKVLALCDNHNAAFVILPVSHTCTHGYTLHTGRCPRGHIYTGTSWHHGFNWLNCYIASQILEVTNMALENKNSISECDGLKILGAVF